MTNIRLSHRTAAMLRKVPEVTVSFWLIKLLSTAMGEVFSDFLVHQFDPILAVACGGIAFIAALALQFLVRKYVAWIYWLVVATVAIFGTMAADVLHIGLGIPYLISTLFFAVALAGIFGIWYASEKTLSIHSIHTRKREAFYWTAILFTFALGTAAGDLVAEKYNLGYGKSVALFAGLIALIALAYWKFKLNAIFAFWAAYVLTRPLGASIGDLFSQPRQIAADADAGTGKGFGFGTTGTSVIFLGAIVVLVIVMTIQQRRQPVLIDEDE